jgi:putative hydrolase of the HAD superfamily
MPKTEFSGILLDLDNTVYDYEAAHEPAIDRSLESLARMTHVGVRSVQLAYLQARHETHTILNGTAASHNRLLYFQRTLELIEVQNLSLVLTAYDIYWKTFLDRMVLREGVQEFFSFLTGKNFCMVTDLTSHIQFRKMLKLNLIKYLTAVVTSEEAGHDKPHPMIFMLALKKLNRSCSECCMIGDNLEKDILGASTLGIKAYWFNPDKDSTELPEGVEEFSTFLDLLEVIC